MMGLYVAEFLDLKRRRTMRRKQLNGKNNFSSFTDFAELILSDFYQRHYGY